MRHEQFGGLTVRITGGSDGRGGGDGPCVVLMHGFGAPGDDLVVFHQILQMPRAVRFAFPAAPLSLSSFFGDSRAWWHIDMERLQRYVGTGIGNEMLKEVPVGLDKARAQVCRMLDDLERALAVPGDKLVLGGFSQGSMLACDIAMQTDRPLAGLVLLSSTLIAQELWMPAMAKRAGLPVFQSHGKSDPILPFAAAVMLRDALRSAGLKVSWHEFAGGHEIPPPVVAALSRFLSDTAGIPAGR